MSDMLQVIRQKAIALKPAIQAFREHIHQHPELSFREVETTKFIREYLNSHGIIPAEPLTETGLHGIIEGHSSEGKVVALRADIDALPIVEQTETAYASQSPGIMHACGHDVHSACLTGALLILQDLRAHWNGKVKFIYQAGEEVLPGGASVLIEKGILENPKVDLIIGQHVFPELPAGKVGFRPGPYMASTDEIYITVKGKGGHGALPQNLHDPVLAMAQILVQLQQIVSRWAPPAIPTVLSFGKIQADGATNVIPSEVKMAGTFRTLDENWRGKAHELIVSLARHAAATLGCEADVKIVRGYPVLENHPAWTEYCSHAANMQHGTENTVALDVRMTAEDFAWYTQRVPGCFYRLGTASPNGENTHSVHSPHFDIDSDALVTGMETMAWLAIQALSVSASQEM